jgi:glutamate-ammonia-ligase adenylyltransferase
VLGEYRRSVRSVLERIYFGPGFLRPGEREEEFAQLLSERTPRERVRQLLSRFGFQDVDKAWQNLRLIGLGPAGTLLPPGERRAFVQLVYPLLEVLRDSLDPDQALHNLESFLTATGNRLSFLRALASRRPHLVRLTNLLALSNLSHQILSRHPEYFDALARGIHLHEGRNWAGMLREVEDRVGASPSGEGRDLVLRRFRQREMIRIGYRDLAGLADPLEISRELSDLAEACVRAAVYWTRLSSGRVPDDYRERLCTIALGKFGSRQMHYSSDLDLVFLYDVPGNSSPEARSREQQDQDSRIESLLTLLGGVTPAGIVYRVDLRLRPEGGSGLLARSWSSFFDHARQFMQPWERMALVWSRMIGRAGAQQERWSGVLDEVVYGFRWDAEAIGSIRHLKRRIESEKNKESRSRIDFKYGRGGIGDLEFLVQFLQIGSGPACAAARATSPADAIPALGQAGAISAAERDAMLAAHRFMRKLENHYQLMEEWASREISRDSPLLIRLARSLGYSDEAGAEARRRFLSDWDDTAQTVRALVDKYFY